MPGESSVNIINHSLISFCKCIVLLNVALRKNYTKGKRYWVDIRFVYLPTPVVIEKDSKRQICRCCPCYVSKYRLAGVYDVISYWVSRPDCRGVIHKYVYPVKIT